MALPVLAPWFAEEWAPYYGPTGRGNAHADLKASSNRDCLPVCLVAFDSTDEIVETASLKAESLPSHRHLTPWLAALLVAPNRRGEGIGTTLVAAVEREARRFGCQRLYAASDVLGGLLQRRGWHEIDKAPTLRGAVKIYELNR